MNPLIKELRDGIEEAVDILINDRALTAEQKVAIMSDVIRAEFNKYPVAAEPKEEGFVEGYINCQCGAASAYKNIHGVICCGNCDKPLDRHPAKAEEPLEYLAKRKGAKLLEISWDEDGWHIYAQWPTVEDGEEFIPSESWSADDKPTCEAKARAFLMGLPDKGEAK